MHTLSESRTAVHYSSCLFSSTKVFSLPHPWAVTEKNIYKGWQKDPWLMDSQINQNFPIMFFVTLHLLEMVLAPWKFDIDRTGLWFGKDEFFKISRRVFLLWPKNPPKILTAEVCRPAATRFWRSLRSSDALPWCTTWQPRRHSLPQHDTQDENETFPQSLRAGTWNLSIF